MKLVIILIVKAGRLHGHMPVQNKVRSLMGKRKAPAAAFV